MSKSISDNKWISSDDFNKEDSDEKNSDEENEIQKTFYRKI